MRQVHAFDIDGVITQNDALYRAIQNEYPQFTKEQFLYYDVATMLAHNRLIQHPSHFNNDDFFTRNAHDIYLNSRLTNGVSEYLQYLESIGVDIHFITARPSSVETMTLEYFKRKGIKGTKENVHHVGGYNKYDVLREVGASVFYEDRAETLYQAMNLGVIRQGFLIDMPYNREAPPVQGIHRVKNFIDIMNAIGVR